MSSSAVHDALAAALQYVREHPEEAAYTDSAAVAALEDDLSVNVRGPDGLTVRTDMPKSVGGAASAPSPGWLLRASQASCLATLIAMRASMLGVTLENLEVTVDSRSDDRGILGIDESVPAGPMSSRAHVRIGASGSDRESLRSLVEWADAHCPVQDAVRRAVPSTLEVEVG